jgi:hypothetical protein
VTSRGNLEVDGVIRHTSDTRQLVSLPASRDSQPLDSTEEPSLRKSQRTTKMPVKFNDYVLESVSDEDIAGACD